MRYKIYLLLIVLLVCSAGVGWAQDLTVSGVITDAEDGSGVPGVTVLVKGTNKGTASDFEGNYKLSGLSAEDVLVFSFIGYATQEIVVGNQSTLDVSLGLDVAELSEVVVIGYGTTTQKELTGSVSVVKGEQIEALKPTRVEQALQGQTAGVQISSESGSPGGGFNIRIRGITTNGDNRPLILVDGVRYDDLGQLNPSAIESINVLKDASAGIYGVQGANGVILITTKDGAKNSKPSLTFNSYFGVQETSRKIPTLNATEYALLVNEAHVNGGSLPPFTDLSGLGAGTDWQDEVFESAPIQDHNFTLNGGGEKSVYSLGGGYFRQEGIVGGDKADFERITGNIKATFDVVEPLKFDVVLNYANTRRNTLLENVLGSVLFNALNMAPNLTPLDDNGDFTLAEGLGSEVINPLAQIASTYNTTEANLINGKVGARYNIIPGLNFESALGFNYNNFRNKTFRPIVNFGTGKVFNQVESSVTETQGINHQLTWDNIFTYETTVGGDHTIKGTLGTSVFRNRYEELSVTGIGIPNNSFDFADISQAQTFRESDAANSIQSDFRLLSYFFRAEYNYKSRYLFSAMIRRDGSTRFGPKNKFGYFPAFSAGWVMSEENFMANLGFVDFFKLRASYGITGNDKIGDFRFVSSLNGEAEYVFDGNTLNQGLALGAISNPEIQWEQNEQFNIGFDADFLDGKLALTVDYFIKTTKDLLLSVPVSGLTGVQAPGGAAPVANAGSIRNQGLEFSAGYNVNVSEDLKIGVNYNVTYLDNETISLNDGVAFIQGGTFGIGQLPPTRWEVGQPIGYFFGLQTDGVFQNDEEVGASAQAGSAAPGDLRYVDQNGDGVIDTDDRTFIGNPIPQFVMGMGINVSYKNIDFSVFADAQTGNDIVRNYERNLPFTNRASYYTQRWHGPGTSNSFPRISTGANDNDLFSDFWLEDGSYLRIKNIQLGYTFPEDLLSKIGVTRLRLYATVNNLVTFTDYQGFDPNVSSSDPLNAGIDIGYYPQARSYIFGLNLGF